MILKSEIKKALEVQRKILLGKESYSDRNELDGISLSESYVLVVSGIRRCGKSTLLKMLIQQINEKFVFLNFEDSRIFQFELQDFSKLDELVGEDVQYYFFDEIQNVENWEVYVRQLQERGKKVFITGSNASLLSKELGTRLTGRHINQELFPFSYLEFISFSKLKNNNASFEKYLKIGGFPEYIESENQEVLQNLMKDIVYRDIAVRYGIRDTKTLMDITLHLFSNVGKEITFNSLRKTFGVGSTNSVADYLKWLEDCYLLFFLDKFSWSSKSIAINPRKVYGIDTGLIQANSLSFSEDKGRLFENFVYLFLRQKQFTLFYFRENSECDFVVFEKKKCKMLIQVCEEIHLDNQDREVKGLLEAMNYFSMEEGFIVTKNQKDEFKIDDKIIHIVPAIEWMEKNF